MARTTRTGAPGGTNDAHGTNDLDGPVGGVIGMAKGPLLGW
ncbi:hypothetical protein ACH4VM_04345 [Streptomyces sp. NPDC020792]